jgi:hypothetical protein
MTPDPNPPIWYDQTPSLKRALLLLKALPPTVCELVAKEMLTYAKEVQLRDVHATTALGYDKVMAMMQTKQHAQAFANDPYLVKALNAIFDLSLDGRHQVGLKVLLSLQAVDSYRQSPKFAGFEGNTARVALHNLVTSVFNENLDVFKEQGEERRRQREEAKAFAEVYQQELEQLADQQGDALAEAGDDADEAATLQPLRRPLTLQTAHEPTTSPGTDALLPLRITLLPQGDARLRVCFA